MFLRNFFHLDDDLVMNYLDDDGQSVEPEWYAPIIPMVLVNGAEGIGTGWSTQIPNHNQPRRCDWKLTAHDSRRAPGGNGPLVQILGGRNVPRGIAEILRVGKLRKYWGKQSANRRKIIRTSLRKWCKKNLQESKTFESTTRTLLCPSKLNSLMSSTSEL